MTPAFGSYSGTLSRALSASESSSTSLFLNLFSSLQLTHQPWDYRDYRGRVRHGSARGWAQPRREAGGRHLTLPLAPTCLLRLPSRACGNAAGFGLGQGGVGCEPQGGSRWIPGEQGHGLHPGGLSFQPVWPAEAQAPLGLPGTALILRTGLFPNRQLLAHFHCLSCDRPLETTVTGQ